MSDSPINHVTDTAFWVATYRAIESERPNALFRDPLAARLVEGRGREIAAQMSDSATTEWAVVIRTLIIDRYLEDAVAGGCDAVLNLGAGLDTRPYRMELPPSLKWVEVDFPDTIRFKEEKLAGERPRCALERLGIDLGDAAARRKLFAELGASARRVLVLTEGVVPYLSVDEAAALAVDLHAQPSFAFWVLDYFSPQLLAKRALMRRRRKQMARAPFKFHPTDWSGFFRERGWVVKEMQYLGEVGRRIGRPAPLPLLAKILMRLSRGQRDTLKKLTGYALLQRG